MCVHSVCVAPARVPLHKLQEAATDCGRVILIGCVQVEGMHNPVVFCAVLAVWRVGLLILQLALVVQGDVPVASACHHIRGSVCACVCACMCVLASMHSRVCASCRH